MNAFVLLKRQIFNLLSERLKIGEVYTKSEERRLVICDCVHL